MINVFAIVVTIIFYGVLIPIKDQFVLEFFDFNVHAANTMLILIDISLSAKPVRLLHVMYPMMYGMVYIVFSLIYWSQDNSNNVLYPVVLDWNNPGTTVGVIIGLTFVGLPLLQLFHFAIYKMRCLVFYRIYKEEFFTGRSI